MPPRKTRRAIGASAIASRGEIASMATRSASDPTSMVTLGSDLQAGVPFYGAAPPANDVAKIRAPMLLQFAENDPRINARWPKIGAEIDGVATPAMTGLVEQTVSFTKGCYTGQEFVARVHYRGAKPPRQLVQINFERDPSVGVASDITIDGDAVGIVTSVVPSAGLGLGYCKRSVVLPAEARVGSVEVSVS